MLFGKDIQSCKVLAIYSGVTRHAADLGVGITISSVITFPVADYS